MARWLAPNHQWWQRCYVTGVPLFGTQTIYIMPGSSREAGYCESFTDKLRNEILDGEFFLHIGEAGVIKEQ